MLAYKRVPVRVRTLNLLTRYAVLRARTGHMRVPTLVAEKFALCDSTRIARYLEEEHPEPPLHDRESPRLAALGRLVEQLADEWIVPAVFLVRWNDRSDAMRSASIIASCLTGGLPFVGAAAAKAIPLILRGRLRIMGASDENRPVLLRSLTTLFAALEAPLARASFLLGPRPTLADFGLYGPLRQMRDDVAGRALLPGEGSALARWLAAMDAVASGAEIGPAADCVRIGPTSEDLTVYAPLLRLYSETWLRFARANSEALRASRREAHVETLGGAFRARARRYVEGCFKDDLAAIEGALTRAGDLLREPAAEAPLWVELEALAAGPAREVLRPFPQLWRRLRIGPS